MSGCKHWYQKDNVCSAVVMSEPLQYMMIAELTSSHW